MAQTLMKKYSELPAMHSAEFEQFLDDYTSMQRLYRAALDEVLARLEVFVQEHTSEYHTVVHHYSSRLKTLPSIVGKLRKQGHEPSIDAAIQLLNDIAGLRIVVSYIDDIYTIADYFKSFDDISIVKESDYIATPKATGYRSYHLVIRVPTERGGMVPVEIQIRTIAMDFWASLEHQIRYKGISTNDPRMMAELKACSDSIAYTDQRMQKIYQALIESEAR